MPAAAAPALLALLTGVEMGTISELFELPVALTAGTAALAVAGAATPALGLAAEPRVGAVWALPEHAHRANSSSGER
jgi:hypothetical protein